MTDAKRTLLVTGASGQLGRRVVELLLETAAGTIVAMTREPEKLGDLVGRGVTVRRGDFDDPGSLKSVFAGVDRALIVSTDAVGRPGGRKQHQSAAVDAAVAAGVKHLVYTSGPSPHPDPAFLIADDHYWTEQAIAASAVAGWTILRNMLYAEVALGALVNAVASGKLMTATGGGARSYVTREDCARAAAAALADTFAGQRILDVTGPAALTQAELAEMASAVSGRPVATVDVSHEALVQGMVKAGLPEPLAATYAGFDRDTAMGYYAIVTPAVQQLTGRGPTPLRAFLEQNREALAAKAA